MFSGCRHPIQHVSIKQTLYQPALKFYCFLLINDTLCFTDLQRKEIEDRLSITPLLSWSIWVWSFNGSTINWPLDSIWCFYYYPIAWIWCCLTHTSLNMLNKRSYLFSCHSEIKNGYQVYWSTVNVGVLWT